MKKNALLLALSLFTIVSCTGNGGSKDITSPAPERTTYSFTGTHVFNYTETPYYMVKDKDTPYSIILPENPDSYLITAKEELIELFKEATGITLEYKEEDASTTRHRSDATYISIGDTQMFVDSGIEINKTELGTQSARVVTKDKTIYLNGGDTHGCIYAVYDLLEVLFDFDTFSYDCVHLEKKEEVKLYNFDITDKPDIAMRANSWGFIKENPNNIALRLRTPYDFSSYVLLVGDTDHGYNRAAIHNSLEIIPRDTEFAKATWFSDAGDQICYTAHGNEVDYELLIDRAATIIEQGLVAFDPVNYPLCNTVTFTMEDNYDTCKCAACTAAREKYGTESGAVIVFCNRLRATIQEWMDNPVNAKYRREDFKLLFFAYNNFINAPATYNPTTNKYEVNHPDLVLRDDVGVYYAISSGIQYQLGLYDEHNKEGVENYLKWSDISSNMYIWTYNANFGGYLSHVNSTNFYNPDTYQFFAYNNAKLLYNQGAWNSYNLTAFQMLAIYLDAKLSWNSNYDMNALIDRWFKYMFLDAAEPMKELFYRENLYSVMLMDDIGNLASSGIINISVASQSYWPFQMLMDWLDLIDQSRALIEPYKEIDMKTYKMLKEHIDLEWVSPAYYLLSLYGRDYLSEEKYMEMAYYFYYEIMPLKFFLVSERSESLSTWILTLI